MPVTLPTDLTFYLEIGLEILLAATLVYCVDVGTSTGVGAQRAGRP